MHICCSHRQRVAGVIVVELANEIDPENASQLGGVVMVEVHLIY